MFIAADIYRIELTEEFAVVDPDCDQAKALSPDPELANDNVEPFNVYIPMYKELFTDAVVAPLLVAADKDPAIKALFAVRLNGT
jgi:hypothetical protein